MPAQLGTIVNAPVRFTQVFGDRPSYYAQFGLKGHEGVDFGAPVGTIITTATKGSVVFAGSKGDNYGNHVVIWDADQDIKMLYAHLQDVTVKTGARVFEGDMIGHLGSTGNVDGPHLHFGIMRTQGDKWVSTELAPTFIKSDAPLNPNNGYKGWEDPRNDSLFNWYLGYGMGEPGTSIGGEVGTPSAPSPEAAAKATFDSIFATYYLGWGRAEAEADFTKTYGGDINKLKIARGIDDSVKKKTPKTRPAALKKIYQLNPQFDQMTLKQIAGGGILKGRVDVLANFLGLSEEEKLRGGQELSLSGFPTDYYPNSSEWEDFLRLTAKGKIGKPGDYFIRPEFAGMNLKDIQGKTGYPFRSDILAGFLGIPENMAIPGNQGFGTQAFPNSYIPSSGEWESFNKIFWTVAPADVENGEGEDAGDSGIPSEPTIRVISSPEKARFYIDGLYFSDLTPSNKPYPVIPGLHEVRVEKSGYEDFITEVEVAEGEQVVVNAKLITSTTTPPSATPSSSKGTVTDPFGLSSAIGALNARVMKIEEILSQMGRL